MISTNINPVAPAERHIILDVLRGLALFGICLANYPEFSLYTFLPDEITALMPTAGIDRGIKYIHIFLLMVNSIRYFPSCSVSVSRLHYQTS